ncbi:MAG: glycosyltransferase family 39 protein [Phormidesmis sp.]
MTQLARRKHEVSHRKALVTLLVGGLIFRSIIACFLPPGFDEAYYFLYTQHLDWSYFDHPLAVALSAGIGIWLTQVVTPLTLRLGSLTLFTGSLWLLYATGRQLFGRRVGFLSCAIASLTPLFFLSFGVLAAPDNALIFFWSGALYLCSLEFFAQRSQTGSTNYQPSPRLIWISLAIGLACLGKYHGFVLGLSLVSFCLTQHQYRSALTSKWLWMGALLFVVTLFPIFYWNAQHDWISFRFQLGDRFNEYGASSSRYSIGALLGAIAAQGGYLFPSLALPLWWIVVKTSFIQAKKSFQKSCAKTSASDRLKTAKIHFLLWSGLPVATGFTLVGGATHTFPAWPAPGLWSLSILLAYTAASWPQRQVHLWLSATGWGVGIVLMFALTHITLGTLQKPSDYAILGGVVTAQSDPSTQLIDVVQLRRRLGESPEFRDVITDSDFIITPEYWLSGYIAMAMPQGIPGATTLPVSSFTVDPRGHAFWFNPDDWVSKDALIISLAKPARSKHLAEIWPYFESVTPLAEIETVRGGEISKTFYLYQAMNLIKPYPYPY